MATTSSEAAREWETLKYDSFFIPNTKLNNTNVPIPRDVLASCPETGLTAFAQLGTHRLNSSRALISLFDRHYQYIVAEATKTIPLRANTQYAEDHLWLCGTAIPRSFGICGHVLETSGPDASPPKNKNAALNVTVVPDLSTDPRFKDRSFVNGAPRHRFYAGVPIRSPRGFTIGVFCIFDDKPREGLDPDSIRFMTDMSSTIMDYLDARRVNDSYIRSERMVLGLGNFIQGQDRPDTWWSEPKPHSNRKPRTSSSEGELDHEIMGDSVQTREEPTAEEPVRPSINPVASDTSSNKYKDNVDGIVSLASKPDSCDSVVSAATSNQSVHPIDPHKVEIVKIFDRAANVIRESLDIDGALFLDASVGSFGGLVGPSHKNRGDADEPTSSSEDSSSGQARDEDEEKLCKLFAVSTPNAPLLDPGHQSNQSLLTEKFLKKLLRRYPNGKIFSFDEYGSWYSEESSGDDTDSAPTPTESKEKNADGSPQPAKKRASPYSRRNEAKTIGQLFPSARSIALVPLWDPYRDRWHAGGFIWSNTASRILTSDADLPYLRAFGMVTMAEISRLDVMVADKAKTDILGSLSHELRSPLHGVVAAAELLHDTSLDMYQVDVVHTIEISGKTLLDTIDHLLAYSKVNTFLRNSRSQRKTIKHQRGHQPDGQPQGTATIESGMMTLISDVNLDVLAEEVIESVFIGHSFQHMVAQQLLRHGAQGDMTPAQERLDTIYSADMASTHSPNSTQDSLPTNLGDVQVIVDIDPHRMWTFHTQPGAIRRIIMNIFGNALKYTSRGHIKVSLKQEDLSPKMPRTSAKAVLTVSDTGKGISEEFLRDKLFTPFSQEDHLAPGTGLGLSLVRQIVVSLGGSISVKSRVGQGTSVTVTLPLSFSQKQGDKSERNSRIKFDSKMLHSLKVSTIGFARASSAARDESGFAGLLLECLPLQWYNMKLCEGDGSGTIASDADVAIYSETAFTQLTADEIRSHRVPGIVVCHNAANAMKLDPVVKQAAADAVFEFIHQPNTPRKFGKTVANALTRWRQLQSAKTPGSSKSCQSPDGYVPHQLKKSSAAVRTTELPLRTPGRISPYAKMSDVTCRLWDLDVDPNFTLKLPNNGKPQASATEIDSTDGGTGTNGANHVNGVVESQASSTVKDSNEEKNKREAGSVNGSVNGSVHSSDGINGINGVDGSSGTNGAKTTDANGTDGVNGANGEAEEDIEANDRSHFLVVDDNAINLKILCTFMQRLNRQYCTAVNGLEALEIFKESPDKFCCILMDINMPVMDGLESTRLIRHFERSHKLSPVTVIAITGLGSTSAREEAFASGLNLFLTRPVRMNELAEILKQRGLGQPEKPDEQRKIDKVGAESGSVEAAPVVPAVGAAG